MLVRDQASLPLRDGNPRLPKAVRIVDLPPYSPELNPCKWLWDVVKDEICNQVHVTVTALRRALRPVLLRYWEEAAIVRRLVGRDWFLAELNVMEKRRMSV